MEPSKQIVNFIKAYESLHDGDLTKIGLQPKLDPVNIWTEGYGRVVRGSDGKMLKYPQYKTIDSVIPFSTIKTEQDAEKALSEDLLEFSKGVLKRIKVPVTQYQFDALLSHSYNCGFSETLYSLVNSKASDKDLKNWFTTKYITAQGIKLRGLQYRRNDEWEIWKNINYDREYKLSV